MAGKHRDKLFIYARKSYERLSWWQIRVRAMRASLRLFDYIVGSYEDDRQEVVLGTNQERYRER